MTSTQIISAISDKAARFRMVCKPDPNGVVLVDGRGRKAAHIDFQGKVTREYSGREALLGASGARDLEALLRAVPATDAPNV